MGFSPNLKVNQGLINDSQLYSLNLFLHKKNIVAKTVFKMVCGLLQHRQVRRGPRFM